MCRYFEPLSHAGAYNFAPAPVPLWGKSQRSNGCPGHTTRADFKKLPAADVHCVPRYMKRALNNSSCAKAARERTYEKRNSQHIGNLKYDGCTGGKLTAISLRNLRQINIATPTS
jgi:hypothetical protein